MNAKQLRELADTVFGKKGTLNSLHQEIAEHFYPERADFTLRRQVGDEFADHLMTSYPVLVRRELAEQIGTMLRPRATPWFKMIPSDQEREDNDAKRWLEWATSLMRRAMYDPAAAFARATKEGDNDFATFGQPAISIELCWDSPGQVGPHLLYRCWHLRDMAWQEDKYGKIGNRFRRWKPTIYDLNALFPGKLHQNIANRVEKQPLDETEVLHMVVDAPYYDKKPPAGQPFWSIYYDCANEVVIEEEAVWSPIYAIPRWQTIGGSQYAYSPATIVALPDARLLQAMTVTLLEAGEKITNPPMVAVDEVVRGDIALYAGGITIVDRDYDERLGDALRPLSQDAKGMPIGIEMQADSRRILAEAFYLNKLKLPQRAAAKTAYEVAQIVQQYIRDALPLFEPMEENYNGDLCNFTFEVLRRANAFGSPYMMPRSLQGQDVNFRFQSPLHEEIDAVKGQTFLQMKSLTIEAAALDKSVIAIPDVKVALRDALNGIGVPATWQRSETTVRDMELAQQSIDQAQQALAALGPASEAASNIAGAQKDMAQARTLAR
jgi:hypothetical protein